MIVRIPEQRHGGRRLRALIASGDELGGLPPASGVLLGPALVERDFSQAFAQRTGTRRALGGVLLQTIGDDLIERRRHAVA